MFNSKFEALYKLKSVITDDYAYDNLKPPFTQLLQSAVLIPLIFDSNTFDLSVLLTKRSLKVSRGKGEICLPGGMRDKCDNNEVENALRETEEETEIRREKVDVLGVCVPFLSRNFIFMRTVIGMIDDNFKNVSNDEVEFIFKLPLSRFLSQKGHNYSEYFADYTNDKRYLHYFHDTVLNNEHVCTYGVTAQILIELAIAVYEKKPEFEVMPNENCLPDKPFHFQRKFLLNIESCLRNGKL